MPSADRLNNFEHGRFVLSNLAAKRAAQIKGGAIPLVRTHSEHPLTIALAEIAEGKIKAILGADDVDVMIVAEVLETRISEPGMLLPSLDDITEEGDKGVVIGSLIGDDHEDELEAEAEPVVGSLSDLLDDEAEVDVVTPESDEETVSLHDLEPDAESDEEATEE